MDGDSTQQPSKPVLCANNCGFFGNPLTHNFCSKCYRDKQKAPSSLDSSSLTHTSSPIIPFNITPSPLKPEPSTSEPPPPIAGGEGGEEGGERQVQQDTTRCWSCNKKVGLLGFRCRCEYVFCGLHRYSDKHECPFDYKSLGRVQLAKANPVVKGSKVDKI